MRSRNERVSPRGWPSLRRALFAAFVLLVALVGGAPAPVAAENGGRMSVDFSYRTPEVAPGTICKGRQYQITAWPYVVFPDSTYNFEFHSYRATVTVTPAILGTITPPSVRLLRDMGGLPALFHYTADRTGHESLRFTVAMRRPVVYDERNLVTGSRTETRIDRVDKPFDFVVIECVYKVTFIYHWQAVDAGGSTVQFGIMAKTRLERNEDGTYAGNGFYTVSTLVSVPGCTANVSDFEAPIGLTGKLLQDSRELELTINYGKGTSKFVATCQDVPGSGGASAEVDSAPPGAPQKPKFLQEGGIKSFLVRHPFGAGNLTILVEQE